MNRLEMALQVQAQLGDTDETIWTLDEIKDYTQEAYDDFVVRGLVLWARSALNDVASTATYALPTTFVEMDRVEKNYEALPPSTSRTQMSGNGYFKTTEGRPYTYLIEDDGITTLRKIPIPSEAATDFYIEFFKKGTPLTTDAIEFGIADRYLRYLNYYILAKCFERDGDGQDVPLAEYWMTMYATGVEMVVARRARYFNRRVAHLGTDNPRSGRLAAPGSLPPYFPIVR